MLGIWVPLLGLLAFIVSCSLASWKTAQTGFVMLFLNVFCTGYQVVTRDMMPWELFVASCVLGATFIGWPLLRRGLGLWEPRWIEFVIVGLLLLNVINYGSYFVLGGADSEQWRINGNWIILAIYMVVGGGAVIEHVYRHTSLDASGDSPVVADKNSRGNLEGG